MEGQVQQIAETEQGKIFDAAIVDRGVTTNDPIARQLVMMGIAAGDSVVVLGRLAGIWSTLLHCGQRPCLPAHSSGSSMR